jgi:hypothetical protein
MKERVIRMYCGADLKFDSEDEAREFYYALGRMCAYGINGDTPGVGVVNLTIDHRKYKEITAAFHPPMQRLEGSYEINKKFYNLDDAFKPFTTGEEGHVFVMGAIPRPETATEKFHYSFHS